MPKKSIFLPISSRPPKLRKPPVRPKGPKAFQIHDTPSLGGPGDPPADFPGPGLVRAQVSLDEWYCYWALAKVMNDPNDPRKPPYTGGVDWAYQVPSMLPGQLTIREVGSNVVDFVVYHAGATYALRVQSALHTMEVFGSFSQNRARDLFAKAHLQKFTKVIDVYSIHFMGDPSGQLVCKVMRDAIKGQEWPDPVSFGRSGRVG
mgnify:CR=1 FL=1